MTEQALTTITPIDDSFVIATDPHEMRAAHGLMLDSLKAKKKRAASLLARAEASIEVSRRRKASLAAPTRLRRQAYSRVLFLDKMISAIRAGYCLVPDMPGYVFAIRTSAKNPSGPWRQRSPNDQISQSLPQGEGRFVDPIAEVKEDEGIGTDWEGKPKQVTLFKPSYFRRLEGLPMRFVHPRVIERTSDALTDKLFDEIVLIGSGKERATRPTKDPIVLGRIIDRTNRNSAAFVIAWFMDLESL